MPKSVEELVDKLLGSPDFYPEKSEEDKKSIAYGIAYKRFKSNRKKSAEAVKSLVKISHIMDAQKRPEVANQLIEIAKRIASLK